MNKRKWYGYVFESQDDAYKQKLYKLPMRFKVRKTTGGNKSETEDDLRAVPHVTALSLPRDRKSDAENWYMTYDLKFAIPFKFQSIKDFVSNSLVPDVSAIRGLEILSYGESFQVYDAQDSAVEDPTAKKKGIDDADRRRQSRSYDDISKGDKDVS
tara:strand:+ start:41 stop:508 length:468 start_codon:yes stop_codon:yes gene_type:complete